jgi:hypothetical protein
MRTILFAGALVGLLSAQANAQVRPQDCRPVFPVVDQVAEVIPPPAVVPPPPVVAHAFPWWLLIPGLLITTLLITHHDDHHHDNVSPA